METSVDKLSATDLLSILGDRFIDICNIPDEGRACDLCNEALRHIDALQAIVDKLKAARA